MLTRFDTEYARWLIFDYLAGHLDDELQMNPGSRAEYVGELIEGYNRQSGDTIGK